MKEASFCHGFLWEVVFLPQHWREWNMQLFPGGVFEKNTLSRIRDRGVVEAHSIIIRSPGRGKPPKPHIGPREGRWGAWELRGRLSLSLCSGFSSSEVAGTSSTWEQDSPRTIKTHGGITGSLGHELVVDDYSIYLNVARLESLASLMMNPKFTGFSHVSWSSCLLDHEEQLWKYSWHCKAIKFMITNPLGDPKGRCLVMLWHFLWTFVFHADIIWSQEGSSEACQQSLRTWCDPWASHPGHEGKGQQKVQCTLGMGWWAPGESWKVAPLQRT